MHRQVVAGRYVPSWRGMRVKRVEAVAVVATQAVMKPTPQITCPATKLLAVAVSCI